MKRIVVFLMVFTYCFMIFCPGYSAKNKNINKIQKIQAFSIAVDMLSNTIQINKTNVNLSQFSNIQEILGKPDKIVHDKKNGVLVDNPFDGVQEIISNNLFGVFYIYDSFGIIFSSDYSENSENADISMMLIILSNTRSFDDPFKFTTSNKYSGTIQINGVPLKPSQKILPDAIDAKIDKFFLFSTYFFQTSYSSLIDSIYSYNEKMTIKIYLNNEVDKKAAFILIKLKQ